jgi:hypothetical protein
MSNTVTLEYLGTQERRRVPVAIVVLVAMIGVAAVAFLWWSDSVRRSANSELMATFEASSQRADAGERAVQGTLAYASPLIWSTSVPESVRDGLRALVEASAADVSTDLLRLRDRAARVTILPWQQPQREAREQLLALLDAQQQRFAGIARDASDIDIILADGPLPTGAVRQSLRASGAYDASNR